MRNGILMGTVGAASLLCTGIAVQVTAQKAGGPKARYQMDVTTASGMPGMAGSMGGSGGGSGSGDARPRGGGLGGMFGGGGGMAGMMGGNGPRHTVDLRLGSTLAASGPPIADHFMPEGMQLGLSVPLITPTVTPTTPRGELPTNFERPKGRMLLFWGCGAKVGPGQPVVLDFAKMAAGQMPPGLSSVSVPADRGPTQTNSRTYGYWPNERGRRVEIAANASLVGPHRVTGNYNPEMKFALNQDFMAPMRVQTTEMGNATNISWNSISSATGYYAHGIGFSGDGRRQSNDIVWWTSANRQEFFGGLTDWLSPATVQRLIGERVVMPPTQTQCQIPAEVKAAGGEMMMLSMYAYGPEAGFAYPPRPANPKIAWNPEWTARVRYRSVSNKIVGMPDMDEMMSGDDDRRGRPEQPRKKCKGGFGGMLSGAMGGGC